MPKTDRRIQRTQRALMDALVILALEKRYDSITIRDITERANVSYSTFFRHFHEKDELLIELLKSVMNQLVDLITHNRDQSKQAEGLLIFQHVAANQEFFRVLFRSQGTSQVLQNFQETIAAKVFDAIKYANEPAVPLEILANHFVVSVLGLVRWWLDHDMVYSVEKMSVIYSLLIGEELTKFVGLDAGLNVTSEALKTKTRS